MLNSQRLRALFYCLLLSSCGGGSSQSSATVPVSVPAVVTSPAVDVSLAHVGDPFVYADANWALPAGKTNIGAWVVRGTIETPQFGPNTWDQDAGGLQNAVAWWTDSNTPSGLLISASPPANSLYNGSFINSGVKGGVFVSQHPVVNIAYSITKFSSSWTRATVGVSMIFPDGSAYFLEQELAGGFNLCGNPVFDRCTSYRADGLDNIIYFTPAGVISPLAFDIRAKLLQSPGMTPALADSLQIIGIYLGSEIYGAGQVDLLISNYSVTAQIL